MRQAYHKAGASWFHNRNSKQGTGGDLSHIPNNDTTKYVPNLPIQSYYLARYQRE